MRRITSLTLGLTVLPLCAGCGRFEPDSAVLIQPPGEFVEWWVRTEQCSGLAGRMSRVEFYSVPGSSFDCPAGRCVGHWEDDHHIYIAEGWLDNELVVRHEMLHELIGHPGHPNPPFPIPCHLTWASWNGQSVIQTDGAAPNVD